MKEVKETEITRDKSGVAACADYQRKKKEKKKLNLLPCEPLESRGEVSNMIRISGEVEVRAWAPNKGEKCCPVLSSTSFMSILLLINS